MSSDILTEREKTELLGIARDTIKTVLLGENPKAPSSFSPIFEKILSCFVSLHNLDGSLRGCIGNIEAFEPLVNNVKANAINSAFKDPRFKALSIDELDKIRIEISVLTPPTPVKNYTEIIIGKHGIILRNGHHNAVFLPQVAPEQGWNIDTTLSHLSMKAGLRHDSWKDSKTRFSVFEAIVFSEK